MIRTCKQIFYFLFIAVIAGSVSCTKKSVNPPEPIPFHYKTENVVIVVVDGARYTETWGDPSHTYIPKRYALLQQGILCNSFYNNGKTSTVAGHTAMSTGIYQTIANNGLEYPQKPSVFQNWLKQTNEPSSKAWIIATKDKLEVLSDCIEPDWKGTYKPMADCGVNGLGTGYRFDNQTFENVKTTLIRDHPKLMLINFKQPDEAGHQGDSLRYLKGIADTDNYVDLLWQALQGDNIYKDKTTMIVTNDHGRHTAGHLD
ncbi:MAG: alkaline phosphatase family protein [Chitinophagaceae bacterium]